MILRRIAIASLLDSPEETARLAGILRDGGVVAVPTETFYGLAADPHSARGVGRILALKERDEDKPLLVLFSAREQLPSLGIDASSPALDRFFAIWPAPLTVILPCSGSLPASRGEARLAVRVPDHDALRRLLKRVGPVTGTSLNRAGEPACEEADGVASLFPSGIDVLVDGGRTPGGLASTLLDATSDPPRVLRPGALAWPPPEA